MTDSGSLRAGTPLDAAAVAAIYNHYVLNTVATFEVDPVSVSDVAERIEQVLSASLPWLVVEHDGEVVGYAYASKWLGRWAYRFSAEVTVYLDPAYTGRGIGSALYTRLLSALTDRRIHAVMGGIALPNDASVTLHEKFGFRKVAHFEEVGFKQDRWIDVGYWHRLL